MPNPNAPPFFRCPNCNALYQVVRAKAGPETVDLEACGLCGGALVAREGQFVLTGEQRKWSVLAARYKAGASMSGMPDAAPRPPPAGVQTPPRALAMPRGLDRGAGAPERTHTFRSHHGHCRLPRLSRSDIRWQFRERRARQVALARSSWATTGEMCQSRARADSAEAAGVSRGRGLLGGADAERTPLADSPRAMQASLDTLFGLHNSRPFAICHCQRVVYPFKAPVVAPDSEPAVNRPPTAAGGPVTTASLSRRASASAARSCATLRRSHRSGIG
jgi:hypothetical protein